ncbi:ATP-binding protein [Desulfosporosinus sp. OT]|uniref:ATP-binding protein n=1 Tax=Desulfosporosinus sp. OT TaxID=913865 RepID=UPI000223A44E|nr:ATP-binding protein [Desulfosporosinus sp. OT]EGW39198.1 sensory box protein [Desulfosporosinus sp. OT]
MQIYFLIFFTGAIFYFLFGLYIILKDRNSNISKMLFIICIDLFLWAIGYSFMFNASNIYLANYWRLVAAVGWCSFFSIWLITALMIKNGNETKLGWKKILLLCLPAVLFYINTLRYNPSDVLYHLNNGWSDRYPVNFLEILFYVYTVLSAILNVMIFRKMAKNSKLQREKEQAKIIGITTLISFTIAILTDIVLPLFQIPIVTMGILTAPIGLIGIWYSIKKYKLIEITPKYVSEYVFEYIFKNVNDPIFIIGEDFSIKKANNIALESMTEVTFHTMVENNKEIFQNLLQTGSIDNIEVDLINKDITLACELSGKVIYDEFKDILGIVIILHDISERKKTEKLLRIYNNQLEDERKRLYSLIDELPGLVCIRTIKGQIVFANHNFKQVFGETNNKQCHYIFYNKDEPCSNCEILLSSEAETRKQWQCVIRDTIFEVFQQPFQDSKGEQLFLMQMNDITKRELALEEVTRLDRLNLVGELAASIAHEVRNPMTTVRGFLQILKSRDMSQQNVEYFDLMISELDGANSILTEFLSIAKTKSKLDTGIKLNHLVNSLYPLIFADATNQDKQVELATEEVAEAIMNEREIRQLILNLTRNGLESMPAKGTLKIMTYMEENNIVLAVQDQGAGINDEIIARLGTPFLTTKEGGTGLGLASCYSISERHNAKIVVESSSSGTTFYVKFKAISN